MFIFHFRRYTRRRCTRVLLVPIFAPMPPRQRSPRLLSRYAMADGAALCAIELPAARCRVMVPPLMPLICRDDADTLRACRAQRNSGDAARHAADAADVHDSSRAASAEAAYAALQDGAEWRGENAADRPSPPRRLAISAVTRRSSPPLAAAIDTRMMSYAPPDAA